MHKKQHIYANYMLNVPKMVGCGRAAGGGGGGWSSNRPRPDICLIFSFYHLLIFRQIIYIYIYAKENQENSENSVNLEKEWDFENKNEKTLSLYYYVPA